jgi:hypothetical protein
MSRREWFAVDAELALSPRFLGVGAALRGHWLTLRARCAAEMNSGMLAGARRWNRTQWGVIGMSRLVIDRLAEAQLVSWKGDDLQVAHFDHAMEESVVARAERNRERSRKRWDEDSRVPGNAGGKADGKARGTTSRRSSGSPDQRRRDEIPLKPPASDWPPKEQTQQDIDALVRSLAQAKQLPGANGSGS